MTRPAGSPRYESPDPAGVCGTYGNAAIAWAKRELGITLGPWQRRVVKKALRYDRKGDLLARTALFSTGRQNGKSVIVRVIFGWMLDEGCRLPPFEGWTELLAAAHDAKQARILYSGVYRDLLSIPRYVEAMKGKGRKDKSLRLTEHFGITVGKLTLDTVTGQPGSSRGHSAGAIAWDEVLTQNDWEGYAALSPTQSAQRSPILLATSTAGFSYSVVLRSFYDQLVRQATGAEKADPTFYGAWWQADDPDAGLDRKAVKQANPALGDGRLTWEAVSNVHRRFPADHFRREVLNHWIDTYAESAVNPARWGQCRTVGKPLEDVTGPFALGVDVGRSGTRATIAVAGIRPDGRIGCEVFRDLRATADALVSTARVTDELHRFSEPLAYIAYDKVLGMASALERDAQATGLPYDGLTPAAVSAACADVAEMIDSGRLAVNDPLLDAQVAYVARRDFGSEGAFRFSRGQSQDDIDAFMAMVFAVHAIAYTLRKPGIF